MEQTGLKLEGSKAPVDSGMLAAAVDVGESRSSARGAADRGFAVSEGGEGGRGRELSLIRKLIKLEVGERDVGKVNLNDTAVLHRSTVKMKYAKDRIFDRMK